MKAVRFCDKVKEKERQLKVDETERSQINEARTWERRETGYKEVWIRSDEMKRISV